MILVWTGIIMVIVGGILFGYEEIFDKADKGISPHCQAVGFLLAVSGLILLAGQAHHYSKAKELEEHPPMTYEICMEKHTIRVNRDGGGKTYYHTTGDMFNRVEGYGMTVEEFCKELEDNGYKLLEESEDTRSDEEYDTI